MSSTDLLYLALLPAVVGVDVALDVIVGVASLKFPSSHCQIMSLSLSRPAFAARALFFPHPPVSLSLSLSQSQPAVAARGRHASRLKLIGPPIGCGLQRLPNHLIQLASTCDESDDTR